MYIITEENQYGYNLFFHVDGEECGFVCLNIENDSIYISCLLIYPKFRYKSLGKLFMKESINWALETLNKDSIWLLAYSDNQENENNHRGLTQDYLENFYESIGFDKIGFNEDGYLRMDLNLEKFHLEESLCSFQYKKHPLFK